MRRGTHETQWGNGPENWVNHNSRFSRGNRRPNFHGFNARGPVPRHWRLDGNFRPRAPTWNAPFPAPQQFQPAADPRHMPHPTTPNRFNWQPQNHHIPPLIQSAPPDARYDKDKEQFRPKESFGLPTDPNLYDTINTVKQKLRERKVSETNVDFSSDPIAEHSSEDNPFKVTEKRRIEHTKMPLKISSVKKVEKKEGNNNKLKTVNPQHSPIYHKKSEVMRRKILKQLFKLDKDTLRQFLSQPESSSKYDFALNSLIKETRTSLSQQLRNVAEKSLQMHETNADSLQGKKIVQDAFMGHLGSMLDTDASVELLNMEPQVIAELSKVLQQDLMGTLNEDVSVRNLANAMQDNPTEDFYSRAEYPEFSVQSSNVPYRFEQKDASHLNLSGHGNPNQNSANYSSNQDEMNHYFNEYEPKKQYYSTSDFMYTKNSMCKVFDTKYYMNLKNGSYKEENRIDNEYSTDFRNSNSKLHENVKNENMQDDTVSGEFDSNQGSTSLSENEINISKQLKKTSPYHVQANHSLEKDSSDFSKTTLSPINEPFYQSPQEEKSIVSESLHVDSELFHANTSEIQNLQTAQSNVKNGIRGKDVLKKESPFRIKDGCEGVESPNTNQDVSTVKNDLPSGRDQESNIYEHNFQNSQKSTHSENIQSSGLCTEQPVSQINHKMKSSSESSIPTSSENSKRTRKRKTSNSSLQEKESDTSGCNISVRKDIFIEKYVSKQSESIDKNVVTDSTNTNNLNSSLISIGCQTEIAKCDVKSQMTQCDFKRCDASSQVYESLISSKSKGTQFSRLNMRDRVVQTLRIEGLTPISHVVQNTENKEIQTEEVASVKNESNFNLSENEIPSKANKINDRSKKSPSVVKPEEVLERMRQIDNDIQALMQEKLGLYNLLDFPSLNTDSEKLLNRGILHVFNPVTNAKNKYLDKLHFQKSRGESPKRSSNKTCSSEKSSTKRSPSEHTNSGKQHSVREKSLISDDHESKSQNEPKSQDSNKRKSNVEHAHKSRKSSSSQPRPKSKQKTNEESSLPKQDKHKSSLKKSKHNNDTSHNKTLMVPGKDINNGKKSDHVKESLNIDTEDLTNNFNNYTMDVDNETSYFDLAGCPVSLECNLVVSEEVVISENDQNGTDQKNVNTLRSDNVDSKKKKYDIKKVKTVKNNSNDKIVKNDCDKIVLKINHSKVPHNVSVVSPIKIRKKRTSSNNSTSQSKPSPLFNLISQLNDTDDDCDMEINKPTKPLKTAPSEVEEKIQEQESQDSAMSDENIKLINCRVHLERLDANKLVPSTKDCKKEISSQSDLNYSTTFDEHYDPSIINDQTLFTTKEYENDEDCMSLEHLDAVQFDDFCDPDVPGIIGNMEVNDSFNIIDQWDSKLFENVSLLEDKEIFPDRSLLEGIVSAGVTNDLLCNANDSIKDSQPTEPINFTDHKDSIIALQCVGDNFLAASIDGNVYYYDGLRGKLLQTLSVSQLAVTCMSLSKHNSQVFTGSLDSFLRCFNYETGQNIMEDVNIGGPIQSMYQEWNTIYIGTQAGSVVQFDIETLTLGINVKFSENSILALHAIKEGPRKVLLIASRSQEVTVKDATTGLLMRSFHGPNNTIYSLLFDSGKIFCGTSGADVQIFDFVSGELVGFHKGGRGAVCLQIYKGLLFTGCYDGVIYIFKKCETKKPIAQIQGPGKMLLAMAVVKNKIIAGCKDKSLSIMPLPKEVIDLLDS